MKSRSIWILLSTAIALGSCISLDGVGVDRGSVSTLDGGASPAADAKSPPADSSSSNVDAFTGTPDGSRPLCEGITDPNVCTDFEDLSIPNGWTVQVGGGGKADVVLDPDRNTHALQLEHAAVAGSNACLSRRVPAGTKLVEIEFDALIFKVGSDDLDILEIHTLNAANELDIELRPTRALRVDTQESGTDGEFLPGFGLDAGWHHLKVAFTKEGDGTRLFIQMDRDAARTTNQITAAKLFDEVTDLALGDCTANADFGWAARYDNLRLRIE